MHDGHQVAWRLSVGGTASLIIGAEESKTLEFKEELNLSTDGDKKKLLKEVSALANASGGYIVFGLEEKNGVASNLQGVTSSDDIDDTVLQLEQIVQGNLDPRIPGLRSKGVLHHGSAVDGLLLNRERKALGRARSCYAPTLSGDSECGTARSVRVPG